MIYETKTLFNLLKANKEMKTTIDNIIEDYPDRWVAAEFIEGLVTQAWEFECFQSEADKEMFEKIPRIWAVNFNEIALMW